MRAVTELLDDSEIKGLRSIGETYRYAFEAVDSGERDGAGVLWGFPTGLMIVNHTYSDCADAGVTMRRPRPVPR